MSFPCAHRFHQQCSLCKTSRGLEPIPLVQLADLAVYQCRELVRNDENNTDYLALLKDAITLWRGVQILGEKMKANGGIR